MAHPQITHPKVAGTANAPAPLPVKSL
jgi:hypothetical protein